MNKYQITIDRSDNVRRLDVISNNNSFNASSEHDKRISNSAEKSEERRKRAFFRHYKKHSEQLVDALKQWSSQLEFIDYEYSDGELYRRNHKLIEPYVQFMDYMKKHLQSGAYPAELIDPNSIQSKRKAICDEIEEIMIKDFGAMPHKPSFNMIINNRIKTRCPQLAATRHADTDLDNFYLPKRIYNTLFDVITDRRTLQLSIEKISQDNSSNLVLENWLTIARGDSSVIQTLKTVLESLVEDDNLRNYVKRYHELRSKLTSNIDFIELKRRAEKLHTSIHGGKLLGGFNSCDLCISDEIADII